MRGVLLNSFFIMNVTHFAYYITRQKYAFMQTRELFNSG